MAKTMRGKTVFCVSHGQFLNQLVVNLISGPNDKQLLETGIMLPHNNSLTIIDFDVDDVEHFKGGGQMVTAVMPRLVATNMQIIPN